MWGGYFLLKASRRDGDGRGGKGEEGEEEEGNGGMKRKVGEREMEKGGEEEEGKKEMK